MEEGEPISWWSLVLALANGMIGGTILVLPIIGLETGWAFILPVSVGMGVLSCYTAYLVVLHLGQAKDIKKCILAHVNQNPFFVNAYSILICLSCLTYVIIYFRLICLQLMGMFGW